MKLVICGDSHTDALVSARAIIEKESSRAVRDVAVGTFGNGRYLGEPFFTEHENTIRFLRDDYNANYEMLSGGPLCRRANILHGFSMGFHTAPLFRQPMWRTFLPWRLCKNAAAGIPVSDAITVAIGDHIMRYMRAFFESLLRLKIDFFVIAAPPPRRSHLCIQEGTAPQTVLEVDRLHRQSTAKWLAERNVAYVLPPPQSMDADGFMLPQFETTAIARDYHHGNEAYGVLMLRDILARYRAPQDEREQTS
jgi:hypothetical protein